MKNLEKLRIELAKQLPFAKWFLLIGIIFWLISLLAGGFSETSIVVLAYILLASFIWLLAVRARKNKYPLLPFAGWIISIAIFLWVIYTLLVGYAFSSFVILINIALAVLIYLFSFKRMLKTNTDTKTSL